MSPFKKGRLAVKVSSLSSPLPKMLLTLALFLTQKTEYTLYSRLCFVIQFEIRNMISFVYCFLDITKQTNTFSGKENIGCYAPSKCKRFLILLFIMY